MEDYVWEATPPEKLAVVATNSDALVPETSKAAYEKAYREYVQWCQEKQIRRSEYTKEDSLFLYVVSMLEFLAPTTARSRYSMLRNQLLVHDNISINTERIEKLLQNKEKKYVAKKSTIFTRADIRSFCQSAPDGDFLHMKAIFWTAINGFMRKSEITNLCMEDLEEIENGYKILIRKSKTGPRSFIMTGDSALYLKKYLTIRGQKTSNRVFLRFKKNQVANAPIGINTIGKMPYYIAETLKLPQPNLYTGHAFRRTAATWAVESGMSLLDLKNVGGWASDTVAQGYIAESLVTKRKIALIMEDAPSSSTYISEKQTSTGADTHKPLPKLANCTFSNCSIIIN